MDKEQIYKEALANARQEYSTTENVERKQWLEVLFPGLKESEDERIRKAIMALIEWSKSYSASGITNDDAKKMFAWLEERAKLVEEYEDRLYRCACESFNKGYKAAIEHQKEKKK